MSPAGKIININAFKNKESGLKSSSHLWTMGKRNHRINIGLVPALVGIMVVTLSYLMTPSTKGPILAPPVDSIASHNIKATADMLVEDEESTEKNRQAARDAVLDVYDFDSMAEREVRQRIKSGFDLISNSYATHVERSYKKVMDDIRRSFSGESESDRPEPSPEWKAELAEAKKTIREFEGSKAFASLEAEFGEKLGVEISDRSLQTLRYYHYWPGIAEKISLILAPIFSSGIVDRKNMLPASTVKGITQRFLDSGSERVVRNFEEIYDIANIGRTIRDKAVEMVPANRPGLRRLLVTIAKSLTQPNLTFNRKETDIRKQAAAGYVKPVFFKIQRGEMIIREGERVTASHHKKLAHMSDSFQDRGKLETFAGMALFNLMLLVIGVLFIRKYHEEVRDYPKMQVMISLLLVGHMAIAAAAEYTFTISASQIPAIPTQAYLLAVPLAFGPMIVSVFFTAELTVLFTVIASVMTGLMLQDYPILALITITGGMVCAYHVRGYNKRSAVLKVGLQVAFVNVLVVLAFEMIDAKSPAETLIYYMIFVFCGGAISALLVSGSLPLIEGLFPVVSDIKLLELTNLNHPLLRRMILEAPGTYHHSIMVGNLAEEACKAINANALLARAGALFHDIGKMRKAEYFSENQRPNHNPHDKLSPNMSTLIVVNHIKDGLELAKQNKLLPQIKAMIPEHHGTQLVKAFYYKAKELENIKKGEVKESDFRYPGPIPGSMESACVALADSIEASARACLDPTPQRLKELVTEVINDKFMQGQLDNSHLTLHDLALISDSFIHTLSGIHHHRVQYPGQGKDQTAASADTDIKKTQTTRDAESL